MAALLPGLMMLLAGGAAPVGAADSDPWIGGRWKWNFTMPDGSVVSPVLKIRADESGGLKATVRFRHATEVPVQDFRFSGDQLSFVVVREGIDRKATIHYSGRLVGETLRGTIESDWAGAFQTYPWEAQRLPETPDGNWKWTTHIRERKLEFTLSLKQEGDKLSGKLTARKGQGVDIHHGHFKNGEVTFEVERERDGEKIVSKFRGTLARDMIRGREVATVGKAEHTYEWVASRED
ncbi:MAG TPA: hypothetical protein DCM86_11735 [Verrucomicrobiales bacterium]|nr:hypothetical protein [Verrucomicrobiales bacterium]